MCPAGTDKYVYNQSALPLERLVIVATDNSTEVAERLLSPSPSDLTSEEAVTLKLQLTPAGRKSDVFMSLQAQGAVNVVFQTDNDAIEPIEVNPE